MIAANLAAFPPKSPGRNHMQILAHLCSENLSLPKISEESLLAEVNSPTSAATEITAPALAPTFLPLAWILDPDKHRSITDRILAQLALAEAKESCADEKQNYRQAFIVVSLAAKDSPLPFVEASYACYGLHPDKLWPAIVARRKADLGPDYSKWYDAAGNRRPDVPKKSSESVIGDKKEEAA